MKELNVAAAFGACALSLPAVGGCAEPSSADMMVKCLPGASVYRIKFHRTFGGEHESMERASV